VLVLGACLPVGASARDAEGLVRVVSPTRGQGVFPSGQVVKVVIRRGARLSVHIKGRDVTGALHLRTVRRSRRTQTLRGRLPQRLVRGAPKVVAFRVRARAGKRRDADSVLVQAVVRQPGFMRVRLRRNGGRAPVEAIVRTRTHRIWLRAKLNGRRIEGVAHSPRLRERRLRLTRTEGLRPGRNVLEIAANSARGRGDVERRVFRLPRSAVIPGVRALDRVPAGAPVVLDAGPSLAPRSGRPLAYRWQFASRPRGSRARLRGSTRRMASFRPDVPGHYSVRLVARPAGRPGTAAAAQSTAGSLVTDVSAQAPVPPYGLRLSTDPDLGLTLDGSTTPMPSGSAGMLAVVIDSTTGVVTQTDPIPGIFSDGQYAHDLDTLLDLLDDVDDPTQIVVVVGAQGNPNQRYSTFGGPFNELSGTFADFGLDGNTAIDLATAAASGGQFALVGMPGSVPGAGTVNVSTESPAAGELDGLLRLTGISTEFSGTLVFEQPDYELFQLGGGQGSTTFSGQPDPPAGSTPTTTLDWPLAPGDAMMVTIIDAASLESIASASGSAGGQDGALTPVTNLLRTYVGDDTKLILFKMNAPTAWENTRFDMSPISRMLASLGANRDIFLRSLTYPQDGQAGSAYVFFGGAGVEPVEGSSLITAAAPGGSVAVSSPTMSGILRKNGRGQWVPVAARSSDALTNSLQALAARAPVAYGYPTDVVAGTQAQYQAAEGRLFQLLINSNVICTPGPTCSSATGVRANYTNPELLSDLKTAQSALDCNTDGTTSGPLTPASGANYTQDQLNALQAQVCGELKSLVAVDGKLFEPLRTNVYNTLKSDSTFDLLTASNAYLGFLMDEQDKELAGQNSFLGISGEAGDVLGDLFSGATDVADYVIAAETGGTSVFTATALGDIFTVSGDSLGLASGAIGVGEDPDKVAPTLVTVGSLYTYIQSSYGYAMDRMNDVESLVTSDPTKLADAAAQVQNGSWNLTQAVSRGSSAVASETIVFQQRVSALQYMWPRLLSVAAKPCDVGGSAGDPMTYGAYTGLYEDQPPGNYLEVNSFNLRSVRLTTSDAQTLATNVFGAPFARGTDPFADGPAGAAIAPSPFFMWQVAPTTDSTAIHCSDDIGD
jgi:hypothetical protein